WTAAAGTQFRPGDPQHLYARILETRVRLDVALVGDDDARRESERVVAVVPLLTFRDDGIETGVDDAKFPDTHGFGRRVEEQFRPGDLHRAVVPADRVGLQRVPDRRIHDDGIGVYHGADGVE